MRWLMTLLIGAALALVGAVVGDWLTPPALARWTIQIKDNDERVVGVGVGGVPAITVFLVGVVCVRLLFAVVKSTSLAHVALAALHDLLCVVGTAVCNSLGAEGSAFSWVAYEPGYFIWPHFIALPLGLLEAARMVKRRGAGLQ